MYRFAYQEAEAYAPKSARQRERSAIETSMELLERAEKIGVDSPQMIEAIHYVQRLWMHLLDDLAAAENDLPMELKAQLISIGIWIVRQADTIRSGRPEAVRDVIEVSRSIADGLQ